MCLTSSGKYTHFELRVCLLLHTVLLYYTDEIVSIWDSCWVIFILPTAAVSGTSKPTRANMAYGRYWVVRVSTMNY